MKEFKSLTARECAIRLTEVENPVVLMHVRPDGDTVGSAAALCLVFEQLGKRARPISADPIPKRLEFILRGAGIEIETELEGKTAVTIDVASPSQLGSLYERFPTPTLSIDHHAASTLFADNYTVADSSSAAETLFDVIEELIEMGLVELTRPLAYALYSAISSDTACMRYSSATPKTYEIAARLISVGIDHSDINHRLFSSKTPAQLRAEGFVASRIKTAANGKIAYATITREEMAKNGIIGENLDTAVDIVRSTFGAEIAFFTRELEDGSQKTSLRSTGADVATVATGFGGGGHIRASACTVRDKTQPEVVAALIEACTAALN